MPPRGRLSCWKKLGKMGEVDTEDAQDVQEIKIVATFQVHHGKGLVWEQGGGGL